MPNGRSLTGHSHDYKRHGTSTLFAAFEVATGKVKAAHKKRRRRKEFLDFMDEVVAAYPRSRLEVIVDNLNIHKKNEEWLARHPKVTFHYTPTRASWLNQVEGCYNRFKLAGTEYFTPIGYTGGWGHFHIPDRLFDELREYLRQVGQAISRMTPRFMRGYPPKLWLSAITRSTFSPVYHHRWSVTAAEKQYRLPARPFALPATPAGALKDGPSSTTDLMRSGTTIMPSGKLLRATTANCSTRPRNLPRNSQRVGP